MKFWFGKNEETVKEPTPAAAPAEPVVTEAAETEAVPAAAVADDPQAAAAENINAGE